jgi:hypothetical protein
MFAKLWAKKQPPTRLSYMISQLSFFLVSLAYFPQTNTRSYRKQRHTLSLTQSPRIPEESTGSRCVGHQMAFCITIPTGGRTPRYFPENSKG